MKGRSWFFVISFCLLFTAGLAYFKYTQIQAAIAYGESFPEPSETVEVVTAQAIDWQQKFVTNASLVASQTVELRNEIAGRVDYIGFTPSSEIKSGQTLISLDDSVEQAELAGAKAMLELTKLKLKRAKKLAEKNLNAADELDVAQANYSAAIADVKSLQAQINKMTLKAPFDAVSGLFQLSIGEYLDAGTVITRLVGKNDTIWLDFNLPQDQAKLHIDDIVMVSDPFEQDSHYQAKVIAADAWVKQDSRNRLYRAELRNAPSHFVPGSHLNIYLTLGAAKTVVNVPSTAIRYNELGANVYVLVKDEQGNERAQTRRVSIGEVVGKNTVITAGLELGERLAANGAFKLRDGVLVNAVEVVDTDSTDS